MLEVKYGANTLESSAVVNTLAPVIADEVTLFGAKASIVTLFAAKAVDPTLFAIRLAPFKLELEVSALAVVEAIALLRETNAPLIVVASVPDIVGKLLEPIAALIEMALELSPINGVFPIAVAILAPTPVPSVSPSMA